MNIPIFANYPECSKKSRFSPEPSLLSGARSDFSCVAGPSGPVVWCNGTGPEGPATPVFLLSPGTTPFSLRSAALPYDLLETGYGKNYFRLSRIPGL
jgi:hypothetical protein